MDWTGGRRPQWPFRSVLTEATRQHNPDYTPLAGRLKPAKLDGTLPVRQTQPITVAAENPTPD